MTEIGDRLKRKARNSDAPASVTIVAVKDGRYVLQELETFSSPFEMTPRELRDVYGADGESIPEVDESRAWARFGADALSRAGHNAQMAYVREHAEPSVEDVFRAAADDE